MNFKRLVIIYISYLVPYIVGNAVMSLAPIYAKELGGNSAITGYYLAISFAALAAGSMFSGTLSERYGRRKPFIVLSLIGGMLSIFMMGQVETIIQLTLFTSIGWFCGGITTTMILILTGLLAEPNTRGRTFGIIGTALPLGQVIGGFMAGPIVDRWDFEMLFTVNASIYIIPLLMLIFLVDHRTEPKHKQTHATAASGSSTAFWLLFWATLLVYPATFTSNLGRPIIMESLDFSNTDISNVLGIAGIVNLPLPFILGWLSDRVGKNPIMLIGYIIAGLGMIMLANASAVWHFWVSTIALSGITVSFIVGNALLTDISNPAQLNTNLSRFATTPWLGGVVGYVAAGTMIENIGMVETIWFMAMLPFISVMLLMRLSRTPVVSTE